LPQWRRLPPRLASSSPRRRDLGLGDDLVG
jgi:hypothetical protein